MALPVPGIQLRTLVPDDLFGLANGQGLFRFFAVEIDRNTESIERRQLDQTAFGRKIEGYATVIRTRGYNEWWSIPNLTVLTITTNATHALNLVEYVRRSVERPHHSRFAFAVTPEFGANWRVPRTVLSHLLVEPWMTPAGEFAITDSRSTTALLEHGF